MVEIKINHEVRDVTTEVALGLNSWELGWCIAGLTIATVSGLLIYFFTPLPIILMSYIVVAIMIPFGAIAFLSYHEMNMLQLLRIYRARVTDPKFKMYGSDNAAYIDYMVRHSKKFQRKLAKEEKRKNRKEGEVIT